MGSNDGLKRLPSLAGAEWLERGETRMVLGIIESAGHGARAVGGAVRNALMGMPVKDVDIATTARPGEVMALAAAAGLKAVPTGIEHGTVTVIARHTPFEVTTLRKDIETFGRHARVTFTADWAEDARRRDFTMNALYCAADGTVHDPLDGYPDLAARRVRFIGGAADRIREDYLRILRFFRFTAEYAGGKPDAVGLAAAVALKDGLDRLSGERVRAELLRLLAAPGAVATIDAMASAGILEHVLARPGETRRLARLAEIEGALGRSPDPLLRLAALAVARPGTALDLRQRLKLSSAEYERLARLALPDRAFDPLTPESVAKEFLYRHGASVYADGALLAWAASDAPPDDAERRARAALAERWRPPELPVTGADVVALGVPSGPTVGHVLARLEEWWIGEDYPDDPQRISAELARLAMVTKS